ncbi:MAG: hypothetical protein IT485_02345 [Gammaproteobacteria bacterium]|nr:hypothetical protein [Gammaproteobacteria bacterium]
MRKTTFSLIALAALALVETAQAYPVRMTAVHQRASSGTLSTLKWSGCTTYTSATGCINPANNNLSNMGLTASTAVWDWNPTTGVLSMTGMFNAASTVGSSGSAVASAVIGDKVTDLIINTGTQTTTAATYQCLEGNFLAGVGANGCLNLDLGADGVLNSSVVYNVGGNANCVQRTIGGDDSSTGNVRTLMNTAGGGGCEAGDGAFNLWTIEQDGTGDASGDLVISNGSIVNSGASWLIFTRAPDAVDDAADAIATVPKSISVMANDLAFTDPVTVAIGTAPTKGTATVVGSPGAPGSISISYTGNSGATGTDTFTYTATDANGSDTATVTITLLDVGANPDTGTTTRNKGITINVGANDTGFTAGNVTVTQVGSCDQGGSFTPGAVGPVASASINYTPATTAPGSASYTEVCTYQITDGVLTDTATVTVTVNNNVPVANAGGITISTANANPSSTSGTVNVGSIAGNSLGDTPATVTAGAGSKGNTSVAGNVITYTPSATFFSGTDTFSYTITDSDPGTPDSASGTITVTIANVAPSLANTTVTATSGSASAPKALTITAGNGAVSQHTLAVTTQATNGNCAVSGTSVTYTSSAGYVGADSCVITVTDGDGSTGTGTVSVTVNAAPPSGGGGTTANLLPGGGGSLDAWALSLLASGLWLRRRRAG